MGCHSYSLTFLRIEGRFLRGQWHVYDYGGFQEASGTQNRAGIAVCRTAHPEGRDQLAQIVADGNRHIQGFLTNQEQAARALPQLMLPDNPVPDQSAGRSFTMAHAVNPFQEVLATEAGFTEQSKFWDPISESCFQYVVRDMWS